MAEMRITERTVDDVTILELEGRLVLAEGELVLRDHVNRLVQQGRVRIILDMKKVTRLDSAGLGMLVSKFLTTHARGGRLKLLNLTDRGDTLVGATKLHTIFETFESEDEAVRSFSHHRPVTVLPPV